MPHWHHTHTHAIPQCVPMIVPCRVRLWKQQFFFSDDEQCCCVLFYWQRSMACVLYSLYSFFFFCFLKDKCQHWIMERQTNWPMFVMRRCFSTHFVVFLVCSLQWWWSMLYVLDSVYCSAVVLAPLWSIDTNHVRWPYRCRFSFVFAIELGTRAQGSYRTFSRRWGDWHQSMQ